MSEKTTNTLIHIAKIYTAGRWQYLFLRKFSPQEYRWFLVENEQETATQIFSETIEEAIRLARREWRQSAFTPLGCGFRYTLPERDEHGSNALFYQMAASYATSNGIYLDEELGHNCIVNNPSKEARLLLLKLKQTNNL